MSPRSTTMSEADFVLISMAELEPVVVTKPLTPGGTMTLTLLLMISRP